MLKPITRREALRMAAAGGVAMAVAPMARAAQPPQATKIVMGFIGVGDRGTSLLRQVLTHPEVHIPAICDIDEKHLNRALDLVEKSRSQRPEGYSRGPEDYRRLLAREDLNCVLISTPQELHAVMSIDSMKAGKFVGSEVPACVTVTECHDLVRTQRETKNGYMLLENLLYTEPVMQVQNMVDKGLFGELTYGCGNYIHEIRGMRFKPDGSLTWRGESVAKNIGIIYPTHAMGPVCRWMGINKGDKLISMVAMASKPAATHEYAVNKFGPDSAAAKVNFVNGDTDHALIRTEKGRLIEIRYDTASPRPTGMSQHSLQGTRGAYESAVGQRMVYLEDRSPSEKWEPLEKYKDEFQHSRWRAHGKQATSAGHGGADYFVIADFLDSIRTGKSAVDVIDAVTWSVIRPLSAESISGSKTVAIPDFASS